MFCCGLWVTRAGSEQVQSSSEKSQLSNVSCVICTTTGFPLNDLSDAEQCSVFVVLGNSYSCNTLCVQLESSRLYVPELPSSAESKELNYTGTKWKRELSVFPSPPRVASVVPPVGGKNWEKLTDLVCKIWVFIMFLTVHCPRGRNVECRKITGEFLGFRSEYWVTMMSGLLNSDWTVLIDLDFMQPEEENRI